MSRIRLMTTAGGTVLSALAIGFFMQTGASVPQSRPALQPAPMLQAVTAPAATAAPDTGDEPALDLSADCRSDVALAGVPDGPKL